MGRDKKWLKRLNELIQESKKANKFKIKRINTMEKYRPISNKLYDEINGNAPIFKILGDYFELLKQNEGQREKDFIIPKSFIMGAELVTDNIRLNVIGVTRVIINYIDEETEEEIQVLLHFDVYKDTRNTIHYFLVLSSDTPTKLNSRYVYEDILNKAIQSSNIKGKQLIMHENELSWDVKDITKRSFSDIYLPNKIGNDLRLYKKVYADQNHLMRYLMVGIPGTGKTESTLVLSNEMINDGVTIIKTSICEVFKEKVKLAQLLEPSLIILDDIDLSLGSRNRGVISPLLHSFLDVLDGTEKITGNVGILATTNSLSLLDIAARRPGRFDKTIIFDGITKENIGNVIKKSLTLNFELKDISDVFVGEEILDLYYEKKLTGSHIYNITEVIYRKALIEFEDITKITSDWVKETIQHEINIVDQMHKFNSEITDTFTSNGNGALGFGQYGDDEMGDEPTKYVTEDEEVLYEPNRPDRRHE